MFTAGERRNTMGTPRRLDMRGWLLPGSLIFCLVLLLFASMAATIAAPGDTAVQRMAPVVDANSQDRPEPSRWIRGLAVAIGLAIWHLTQRLIGGKRMLPPDQAEAGGRLLVDQDMLLGWLAGCNRYLNGHPGVANLLLIVSSLCIDLLGGFLLVWSILGPSIRPFLGLLLLFAMRQVCQAWTALPPPPGMVWRYPGFPSLLVTYDVSNDLFFSGHTALAVFGAVQLGLLGPAWLIPPVIALALFEIVAVLALRAHYTIDVFTGIIAALYASSVADWLASHCDRALVALY